MQRSFARFRLTYVWSSACLALSSCLVAAEPNLGFSSPAAGIVGDALQAEMDGDLLSRERLLTEATFCDPHFAGNYWYQGKLLGPQDNWMTVDQAIEQAQSNAALSEYETFRSDQANDVQGHWKVAIWCAQRGLGHQCRAHLMHILILNPDHAATRKALGHIQVGHEWLTPEDQSRMANKAERAKASFVKYWPRIIKSLKTVNNELDSNLEKLFEVDDPLAIPALETAAEKFGKQIALPAMDWLGRIDHQDAALALARFAIYCPDHDVRQRAIENLKSKSLYDFVPELLSAMSSPIVFMTVPAYDHNGTVVGLRQAFARESMHENRLWNFDSYFGYTETGQRLPAGATWNRTISREKVGYDPNKPFGRRTEYRSTRTLSRLHDLAELDNALNIAVAQSALLATSKMREIHALAENQAIQDGNLKIASLIESITDAEFESIPSDVWNWWDAYNETDYQRTKYPRRRYNRANFVARLYHDYVNVPYGTSETTTYGSCFVAGTPVMTLRGLKAIESIRPGDQVLSRDINTGELCFKPVIAATTRFPAPTVTLKIDEELICATTSHLLWVSGKGWTKAGEIEVGDLLHSTAVPAVVMNKRPSDVLPTHNLIVADHHTYFVGSSRVLSHDVLPRGSVRELIPGQYVHRRSSLRTHQPDAALVAD